MIFCDAHVHLVHCNFDASDQFFQENTYAACTAFHFTQEFKKWEERFTPVSTAADSARDSFPDAPAGGGNPRAPAGAPPESAPRAESAPIARPGAPLVLRSFGIHPQVFAQTAPGQVAAEFAFLERLLAADAIDAIGECGFDLFTPEFRATLPEQERYWRAQLELAARYGKTAVVHCRKAMELVFASAAPLRAVPAVVFHSFPGTPAEARALLRRGVNAFFSVGKPLLNGRKATIACAAQLPPDRLLLETDAPYQTLKGESATHPADIARVYAEAARVRACAPDELCAAVAANFARAFSRG